MSQIVVNSQPSRKRSAVSKASKKQKKQRKTNIPRRLTPKLGGPLGQTFTTVMSLCETFTLSPSAGGATAHRYYRANGIFDPTFGDASTHQPYGFDQLAALYSTWVVHASSCEYVIMPQRLQYTVPTSTNGNRTSYIVPSNRPMIGCLATTSSPVSIADSVKIESLVERPGTKSVFFNDHTNSVRLRTNWTIKKALGNTKSETDDAMQGATSDPVEEEYFQCIIGSGNSVDSCPATQCLVRINYKVTWSNPKSLARSD